MGLIELDNSNSEEAVNIFNEEIKGNIKQNSGKLGLNPENVEQGLAKLVLTIIELLRKLIENQAHQDFVLYFPLFLY